MEIKNYTDGQAPAVKEEPKKIEAVVHSKGTRKRNKLMNSILAEEATNAKNYIWGDVLIPALKKAISDVVTNGIDILLYGEAGRSKKSSNIISYRSYYDGPSRSKDRYIPERRSTGYEFDDLIFETRGEAELVLDNLFDILERYRVVTVADLYDLAGAPGRYTDNKFGWTRLDNASVARIRDGYVIKLPRALAID